MSKSNKWQLICNICILIIICILAFLFAKYIVRKNISADQIPVDTSDRLK